jgi:crossover junction endodeoxyribonuclease RusA
VADDVEVTLVHFYRGEPALDTDNMIKPILDAMKGTVFTDDRQVVDVHAGARNSNGTYDIDQVSDVLWTALDAAEPFVYVRVRPLPEQLEVLP